MLLEQLMKYKTDIKLFTSESTDWTRGQMVALSLEYLHVFNISTAIICLW